MIGRGDKGKMCSAVANMPPRRTTDGKIKIKTNGIFYSNICLCPQKRGVAVIVGDMLKVQFLQRFLEIWGNDKKVMKKENKGKLNSCCHDIHVFMPARRQFSVQGVSSGKV